MTGDTAVVKGRTQEEVLEEYLRLSRKHSGPLEIGDLVAQAITDLNYTGME
jgi:hypothetical protein